MTLRSRQSLSVGIFSLLAFFLSFCLAHPARGELRTITVDCVFAQQGNPGYFGLSLPINARLFVQFDDEWFEAWDAVFDDTIGIYRFPDHYGGLSFGSGIGFHWIPFRGTEARVWNGYGGLSNAVSFGSAEPISAYGLSIDAYRIYALFPNLFFTKPAGWNDRLHWVADMAGDYRFELLSYVYIFGHTQTPSWTETWLQTTTNQRYFVTP